MALTDKSILTPLDLQLCIAHYCDLHGPTPLMVTEGLPVQCSQCPEDDSLHPHTANGSERVRPTASSLPTRSSSSPPSSAGITDRIRSSSLDPPPPLPRTRVAPSAAVSDPDQNARPNPSIILPKTTVASAAAATTAATTATATAEITVASAAASATASTNTDAATDTASATCPLPAPFRRQNDNASDSPLPRPGIDLLSENRRGLPRHPSQSHRPRPARDSGFSRTYDEYVTRRATPCVNCALTLPGRRPDSSSELPDPSPSSSTAERGGPTLRTRTPCARVLGTGAVCRPYTRATGQSSPLKSYMPATGGDTERSHQMSSRRRGTAASTTSPPTSAFTSAPSSSSSRTHTHYLDYTSTHEPLQSRSFSVVRNSCLRTLSFEILPRIPATATTPSVFSSTDAMYNVSPQSPIAPASGASVVTHSAGAAVSGGPIFFGDPSAGFTTAYIFRIPDVHARGHKRIYALMALSTHREHITIKAFGFIAAYFRELASWIQKLAEAEAESQAEAEAELSGATSPLSPTATAFGLSMPHMATTSPLESPTTPDGPGTAAMTDASPYAAAASAAVAATASDFAAALAPPSRRSGTSFLNVAGGGLSRRTGMGCGPGGFAPKARGLAELVGLPDFFIELHKKFVQLLIELNRKVSAP